MLRVCHQRCGFLANSAVRSARVLLHSFAGAGSCVQSAAVVDAEESMLLPTSRGRSEAVAVNVSPSSTGGAPRQEGRDDAVPAPAAVRQPDDPE